MSSQVNFFPAERSASMRLALIFALRMFGLFIVLPIFVPFAHTLPDGGDATLVGLAMGAYGLTQALLYIPYGLLSDRLGRKPLITIGLLIFAVGAFWAANATTVHELVWARALQGAGAVSSVVVAMVSDVTREQVRTRAMAMVGMSIALTFAVSLVTAPLLYDYIGMDGVFYLIAALALLAIGIVWSIPLIRLPNVVTHRQTMGLLLDVLRDKKQWQLNIGVFVLHVVQMAMWVVVPSRLIDGGLSHGDSAWVYLVVIVLSMAAMVPLIIRAEKYGRMFEVMRASIALIGVAQLILAAHFGGVWVVGVALLLFFVGFNVLEATQPSLLSKISAPQAKGAAAGVYNTVQALGLFVGAWVGAWLNARFGSVVLFGVCAALAGLWLLNHQLNKAKNGHVIIEKTVQ
jgi:MFS family permease